jgi:hypothetical protein
MAAGVKTLHHFVPRFYLKEWAPKGQIFCLQNRVITPRSLMKVAAQKHFYKLNEISPEDAEFDEKVLIDDSPEGLKESHRFLLHAFALPHIAKRTLEERKGMLEKCGKVVDEDAFQESMALIDQQIFELNENYHTSIENMFQPILELMKAGDLTFFDDPEKRFAFYYGLSVQYARTNHIGGARSSMKDLHFERYMRVANVLTHIIAINVGSSLIGDHEHHRIVLPNNTTDIPFVTADQPLINLSARPKSFEPPAKFELYYPVSPTKAIMLLNPDSAHMPRSLSMSAEQVRHHNLLMSAHSSRQVYSNSDAEFEAINSELQAFLSCF